MNDELVIDNAMNTNVFAFSLDWFSVDSVLLSTRPVLQLYRISAFEIYVLSPFGMDFSFLPATLATSRRVPPESQNIAAPLDNSGLLF